MADPRIEHRSRDRGGSWVLLDGDAVIGELDYALTSPSVMNIHHTGVRDAYTGRGLARELVMAAVAFARGSEMRITPTCSYAHRVLHGDPAFADVLA